MCLPKRSFRRETIYSIVAACCFVLSSTASAQVQQYIMIWGMNAPTWNSALGVNAIRLGCSSAPAGCVSDAERTARSQQVVRVFLAIPLDGSRTLGYAREYSRLSVASPVIYEVGIDDFVGQSQRQELSPPALSRVLSEVVTGLKSENPRIQFGITLYMDELESRRFQLAKLSSDFRERVNFVHLYPHYRKEGQDFKASLQQVRAIFPAARVIAGLYAYDRRDYLPCARGSRDQCSNDEEVERFRQSLEERWRLLRDGEVAGIEFYPGNFGLEEQWSGWRDPRSCRSDRMQECIANTKLMRNIVRKYIGH